MLQPQSLTIHPKQSCIAVIGFNWVSLLKIDLLVPQLTVLAVIALPSVLPIQLQLPSWIPIAASHLYLNGYKVATEGLFPDTTTLTGVPAGGAPTGLIRNACFVGKILHVSYE